MRVGSLFAGVGGFDLAFERCGMETVWMVEQDKQCQQVLRHHWPKAEVYGDIREVGGVSVGPYERDAPKPTEQDGTPGDRGGRTERTIEYDDLNSTRGRNSEGAHASRRTLEPVDLISGGFPCQDYSVAGKRGGLAGDRGALWWEMRRIIADIMPTWVIGENVPGLLSSNGGRDFITIIASLVQLGYGCTWAVLDSQYFGVAQRRRRLFIIGHSGGEPRPEILALSEGMFGHPAPSREAGEDAAGSPSFSTSGPSHWREGPGTLTARDYKDGHDAGLVMSFKPSHYTRGKDGAPSDVFPPLSADADKGDQDPVVAFNWQSGGDCRQNPTEERMDALSVGQVPAVAIQGGENHGGKKQLGPGIDESGTMYTLGCREVHGISTPTIPRRLTSTECERLQGFPDGHTAVDGMKDGPRYRMMGNAVTVNVVEWIGQKIVEAGGR